MKVNTKINNIILSSYDVPLATAGSLKHEWYNDQKLKIESHCHDVIYPCLKKNGTHACLMLEK